MYPVLWPPESMTLQEAAPVPFTELEPVGFVVCPQSGPGLEMDRCP